MWMKTCRIDATVRKQTVVVLFPGEGISTAEAYRFLRAPRLTAIRARPTIVLVCEEAWGKARGCPPMI